MEEQWFGKITSPQGNVEHIVLHIQSENDFSFALSAVLQPFIFPGFCFFPQ